MINWLVDFAAVYLAFGYGYYVGSVDEFIAGPQWPDQVVRPSAGQRISMGILVTLVWPLFMSGVGKPKPPLKLKRGATDD